MSVIEEWDALHLTPEGWQPGSYRRAPWQAVEIAPPAAGVLTVRRHVTATYCGPSRAVEDRTPEITDMALIEALLERHGDPVFRI